MIPTPSVCAPSLAVPLALASQLMHQAQHRSQLQPLTTTVSPCPNNNDPEEALENSATDALKKEIDDKILCEVMCCCKQHPGLDKKGQKKSQVCVEQTLKQADQALGFTSRYKAEISYNMRTRPPAPFMHRDPQGQETTEPSQYWLGRAQDEIEGFGGGKGMVRRPDVVIVKDPNKPPTQDNIERVVEMKFAGDTVSRDQQRAYQAIAGGEEQLTILHDDTDCHCGADDQPRPLEQWVEAQAPSESASYGKTLGLGIATAVAAALTIGAALVPFDGPVGELALASATSALARQTQLSFWRLFMAPKARI